MNRHKIVTILSVIFFLLFASMAFNILLLNYTVIKINDLHISNNTVFLTEKAKKILDRTYTEQIQYNEVPLCLTGISKDDKIIIDNAYPAEIIMSNSTTVEYVSCPVYFGLSKVVGTIHNHPSGYCVLSETDIKTYMASKQRGQDIIALYCGEYIFYALTKMELTFDNE